MKPEFALAFLVCSVILLGCIGTVPGTEKPVPKDSSVCENAKDFERFNCYVELAKKTGDLTLCERLPDSKADSIYNRDSCYERLASIKKDIGICDTAVKSDLYKYMCYRDLAIEKNDSSVCGRIGNESERKRCYDDVKHTVVLVLQPVTNPLEIALLMIASGEIAPLLSVLSVVFGIIVLVASRQTKKYERICVIIGIALLLAGIVGLLFLYVFPSFAL